MTEAKTEAKASVFPILSIYRCDSARRIREVLLTQPC